MEEGIPPEMEPQQDPLSAEPPPDLMPPEPPKRGGWLAKILALVVFLALGAGAFLYFLKAKKNLPTVIEEPAPAAVETPTPTPTPEPPSLAAARELLLADAVSRKNLVTQIVNDTGPKAEAINLLATSFPTVAPEVKTDIVAALGLLGKTNPEAIPTLISALDGAGTKREAIAALGSVGPAAKDALPKLKKIAMAKKEKKPVKLAAQKAIKQIQGKTSAAKPKGKSAHKRKRRAH